MENDIHEAMLHYLLTTIEESQLNADLTLQLVKGLLKSQLEMTESKLEKQLHPERFLVDPLPPVGVAKALCLEPIPQWQPIASSLPLNPEPKPEVKTSLEEKRKPLDHKTRKPYAPRGSLSIPTPAQILQRLSIDGKLTSNEIMEHFNITMRTPAYQKALAQLNAMAKAKSIIKTVCDDGYRHLVWSLPPEQKHGFVASGSVDIRNS